MTRSGIVAAVLASTLVAGGVNAADVAPVCSDWGAVDTPSSGKGNALRAVDALDASNVWAAGHGWNADGRREGAPLAMRWDGSGWAVEPLPDLTYLGVRPTLESVGIAPTGDPWVVGRLRDASSGQNVPLILRWSRGLWEVHRVAMVDSFAPRYGHFRDVAALTEQDAWAVGEAETLIRGALEPFAAHWDGTTWSEVVVPGTADGNRVLTAVSAAASDAVWAVGYDVDAKGTSFARIHRFDGSSWSVVDQPAAAKAGSELHDIVALAANDIWAVGGVGTEGIFMHWNGSSWTPYAAPANADARSVDGIASNDVWAAGASGYYHWDGTSWSALPSSADSVARRTLAVAGPCDAWSVTSSNAGSTSTSLVERLGPPTSAPVPPPTPAAFTAKPKSPKHVVLEWLPGGDTAGGFIPAEYFVIERCVGEAGACLTRFTVIQKVIGKLFAYGDSGLQPGTSYTYRISAVNGGGQSDPTSPETARTFTDGGPSTLPVPGSQAEGDRRGPVKVTDPAEPEAAIAISEAPSSLPVTVPDGANGDGAVVLEVRAQAPLPPQRPAPPATPTAFTARPASSKQIVLEWAHDGDPTGEIDLGFVIERCVGESGACLTRFAMIGKVDGPSTFFIDGGLRPASAYTYRVYAVNAAGKSAPTAPETALTLPPDSTSSLPAPGAEADRR